MFTQNSIPTSGSRVSTSGDFDSGALGDFDWDGDLDFVVADGNNSQNVYFFENQTYPTYVSSGSVSSKNLLPCSFLTSDNAIVSATIHVTESRPTGTTITYYLSNSDDDSGIPKWEGPVTNNVEFTFTSPGQFLRWKAEFTTADEAKTPKILSISIDYKYIGKREYSRTSQAYTTANISSSHAGDEEVLYAASFEFPTWKGHLRSWDVTNLTLAQTRNSQLADILDVGAAFGGDAGEILRTRDYSTRIVYTAYDLEGDGIMNNRLEFNVSRKDILDNFLGLGEGSPEAEPLIKFVLGDTRNWKLGDINHSSPQALNPPNGNGALMGAGYSEFVAANASRRKVVLVGANDGMLHCFDAATMEELWAFIPNNLLYKLKRMWVKDEDCGIFLQHQFFVDGTPAIQDVFFAGVWHTVLVCGQGPGWGKNNKCYYFALDVTDPLGPLPLWEFTHDTMGETWSVPVISNVRSENKWIAFFGSGYDNDPDHIVGNTFYAVDVQTGSLIRAFAMVISGEPASPFGIQNTLPGSPSEIDSDRNGYINAVYIGDLLGRLWKLEVSPLAAVDWAPAVLYSDPFHQPIITKPEIGIDMTNNTVRVYFGTGGDEKATNTAYYSFIALKDVSPATVEWYMGNQTLGDALHLDASLKKSDLAQGEKVWADPVISNNLIYVATLYGSIESLNPCLTLPGVGKIYSRYISSSQAGTSALLGSGGEVIAYLETKQKVRSAVTVGNTQTVQVGSDDIQKSKVFIQSYTRPEISPPEPPSQVLAQPVPSTRLVIKSWREVYRIFR
jgi:Tfp pilus tip-associated adhesin PilY1